MRALLFVLCCTTAASAQTLLVANQADHTVSVIDVKTGSQTAIDEQAITGHELTVLPDGKTAIVPIYGNAGVGRAGTDGDSILILDLSSKTIVKTIHFPHGVRPHLPVYDPTRKLVFVSTELDKTITAIDPKTWSILYSVPTGAEQSHMFTISHDGRFAYSSNVGPGTVSVIDLNARKVVATVPIAAMTQRISIARDDRHVFAANYKEPELAVIDTANRSVSARIPLPGLGYGSATTPDGKFLLIAIPLKDQVAVVDLAAQKVARTIDVTKLPQEIVVAPDGKTAYVSDKNSGEVAVLNLMTWKIERTLPAGKGADGLALIP